MNEKYTESNQVTSSSVMHDFPAYYPSAFYYPYHAAQLNHFAFGTPPESPLNLRKPPTCFSIQGRILQPDRKRTFTVEDMIKPDSKSSAFDLVQSCEKEE